MIALQFDWWTNVPFPAWSLDDSIVYCSTVTMLVKSPGSSLVGLPWLWVWEWDKSWKNTKYFYLIIFNFSSTPGLESEAAAAGSLDLTSLPLYEDIPVLYLDHTQLSLSMPGHILVSILSGITVPLPWCAPDPVLVSQPCYLLYLLEDHLDFRNHECSSIDLSLLCLLKPTSSDIFI